MGVTLLLTENAGKQDLKYTIPVLKCNCSNCSYDKNLPNGFPSAPLILPYCPG